MATLIQGLKKKDRLVFLDLAKAIAIIAVVALHSGFYNLSNPPGLTNYLQYALRITIEPVPIFFAINGFLLAGQKEFSLRRHLVKTLDIVVCTVIWSVIIWLAKAALSGDGDSLTVPAVLRGVLTLNISSRYIGPLWFMQAMAAVYLLWPCIRAINKADNRTFKFFLALCFFVVCVMV